MFDLDRARDGLHQMLWGMLKKVLIADNVAGYVDRVYSNHSAIRTAKPRRLLNIVVTFMVSDSER